MRFPGIIPAVTTPFDADGAVDTTGLAANVRFLLDAGVHGIVGTGTMGEAGSLDAAERRLVLQSVCEAVGGAVPVIAGVSAGTAAAVVAHARAGRGLADGLEHEPALGGVQAAGLAHRAGADDAVDPRVEQEADVGGEAGGVDRPVGVERRGHGGDDPGEAHGGSGQSRVM